MRFLMFLCLSMLAAATSAAQAAPKVVASIQPIQSLVTEVMRNVGTPQMLVPLGASPHSYALKPSQAKALSEAEIVFWIGSDLESFLPRPLENLAGKAAHISLLKTPDLIRHAYRGDHDHDHGHGGHDDHKDHDDHGHKDHDEHGHKDHDKHDDHDDHDGHGDHDDHGESAEGIDPHIWLDPQNAIAMTRHIANVLSKHDPANAEAYNANARQSIKRLQSVSERIAKRLQAHKGKRFVTFHDAYQYLEKRFDLEPAIIIALNPEIPPGARRIRELEHEIEDSGAACIFFEPQFSGRVAYGLSEATGVPFSVLDPMGPLAVAGVGQYALTLLDMVDSMDHCLKKK